MGEKKRKENENGAMMKRLVVAQAQEQ